MNNLLHFIDLNRFHIPKIIDSLNYQNYTEIGVQNGIFFEFILNNTRISELYAVDPFKPCNGDECGWGHSNNVIIASEEFQNNTKQDFLKKISKYKDRAKFTNISSIEYGNLILDESLDIVFIDGDHSENGVLLDLEIFYKKIKRGGLLVGHDYGGNYGPCEPVIQVQPAVDKFCLKYGISYFVTTPNYCYNTECVQSFFIYKK